uniref:CDC42 effector protein (Rho GTPase binding) 3 n=1 Tax=Petromyzon marinus TaxID=7757 RepID=S4RJD4_PETMA
MPVGKPIYLKTPLSKRGRKVHLRDILTPEMISSPMGELRHLAHIGRAGKADMFGDLTFLQGRFDLVPDFRGRLSTASEGYMDGREADLSADQPMLKTAVSLPALIEPQALPREHEEHSGSVSVGSKVALMLAPPKPPRLYLDQAADEKENRSQSSSLKSFKVNRGDRGGGEGGASPKIEDGDGHRGAHIHMVNATKEAASEWGGGDLFIRPTALIKTFLMSKTSFYDLAGSLISLQLDLGPSMLEDILSVMEDKNE